MENYNGGDMRTGFWSVVFANFQKEMEETIQGYDTVVVKWKNSIRPKVAVFSVVYDSVQRMDENGSSDLVLFQNANHPCLPISSFPTIEESDDEHEICHGYLTEKEHQQLLLDEEALRETLEEETKAEKERAKAEKE
ncbi:hypothetical protein Tco_0591645 [Tanacetum coccineum]